MVKFIISITWLVLFVTFGTILKESELIEKPEFWMLYGGISAMILIVILYETDKT